jgi:hypothetical protein
LPIQRGKTEPPNWEQVDGLSDELLRQLISEPDTEVVEILNHYLDDAPIRERDEAYARRQRQRIRRFVETGEYKNSTPIPLWSCAVALALVVAVAVWFMR